VNRNCRAYDSRYGNYQGVISTMCNAGEPGELSPLNQQKEEKEYAPELIEAVWPDFNRI